MRRFKEMWRHIDGPLGILLVAVATWNVGYVVRGYEDGGLVASLTEKIKTARLDERQQCDNKMQVVIGGYQERAKMRDAQVDVLTYQYHTLAELIHKGASDRQETLRKATEAAEAAKQAAANAHEASKKADNVDKKLETATNPVAVVPKPWVGSKK